MNSFVKLFEEYHNSDKIITKSLYRNWKEGNIDLNSFECRWSGTGESGDIVLETGLGTISWNIHNEEINSFEGDGWVKADITLSKDIDGLRYFLYGEVSSKYDREESTFEFEPDEIIFSSMKVRDQVNEGLRGDIRYGGLTKLSIHALKGKEDTVAFQVLKFIYDSGEEGVRYTDILKFILSQKGEEYTPEHRGRYSSLLSGIQYQDRENEIPGYGLLPLYCTKLSNKRWVVRTDVQEYLDSYFAMKPRISKKGAMLLHNLR